MRTLLPAVAVLALLGVPSASAQEPPTAAATLPAPLPFADPQPRRTPLPPSLPVRPVPPCGTAMFPGFPDWVVRPAGAPRPDGCRVHPRTVPLPPYVAPHAPTGPAPGAQPLRRVEGSGP